MAQLETILALHCLSAAAWREFDPASDGEAEYARCLVVPARLLDPGEPDPMAVAEVRVVPVQAAGA